MTSRNMFTGWLGALAAACTLLCFPAADGCAAATFTLVEVPDATGTEPAAINDSGTVAGVYTDSRYTTHCFVRASDGTISYCDPKNSINTFVAAINDSGTVVGTWNDSQSQSHGFVYTSDGTVTSFDPPGSVRTDANGIDAGGDITGQYLDSGNVSHGFICSGNCKSPTSFDVPGASGTVGMDINDSQTVAGFYLDGNNNYHAFVRTSDGTVTTIDPQNSFYPKALFINDKGVIAGEYQNQGGYSYGFVRDATGTITSFQADGSPTYVGGLNSKGAVCGSYDPSSFIRSPGGTIKTYTYKHFTSCTGINATNVTTGPYRRTRNGASGGYIRTP